jgi:hypothetical protein
MKNTGIGLLMALLLTACSSPENKHENTTASGEPMNPKEARQDSLFREMMAIHDDVMPEMDNIMKLKRALNDKMDSLQNAQGEAAISTDSLKQVVQSLEAADDAMMNWMRSNDFEFEGMSHEEIMQELRTEQQNITVVRDMMLNSIEQARKTLAELN